MTRMVEQLIELARSRLGGGIPVKAASANLGQIVTEVTNEERGAHPGRSIAVESQGDLNGDWDADRLAQVVSTLIENAIRHGAADAPVSVRVGGSARAVALAVHNTGPPIPNELTRVLFDLFRQGERDSKASSASGLGPRLDISRQIVSAHGGTIDVQSSDSNGMTFTIELPRSIAPGAGESAST
jgi:sigma-B regulation protein RsbU (phosphoserine phosphatase)